jgi:hypothetical protein
MPDTSTNQYYYHCYSVINNEGYMPVRRQVIILPSFRRVNARFMIVVEKSSRVDSLCVGLIGREVGLN